MQTSAVYERVGCQNQLDDKENVTAVAAEFTIYRSIIGRAALRLRLVGNETRDGRTKDKKKPVVF